MLKLENVSFQVDGKYIVKNINLNLEDNKIIVITGPNGGGKSTMAKIIAG
ncbi:MAG: ATP-binding cassette domain-containing protein, partial [Erysipelotrichaceae bacterium]